MCVGGGGVGMCTQEEREIYFKELAQAFMEESGRYGIYRTN